MQVRLSENELSRLKLLAENATYADALASKISKFRRCTPVVPAYDQDRRQVKIVMPKKLQNKIQAMADERNICVSAMVRELIY